MGFWSSAIGFVEDISGIDIPLVGPGDRFLGGNRAEGLGVNGGGQGGARPGCPPGTTLNRSGQCQRAGAVAAVQAFVPGGQTGTIADDFGEAVIGAFGIPALVPKQVGTIERKDGSIGPILRCPTGAVLATDNLCYTKGTRGLAQNRKWRPGTRPFLTGGDVRCLRRANSLRSSKGSKKLLKELGMG
jgi:hypothetical protein